MGTVKSHPKLRRYCFKCKKVHSVSDHKHHGKKSFMKVRSKKSYAKAVKSKSKRRTQKKFGNKVDMRLRKLKANRRRK